MPLRKQPPSLPSHALGGAQIGFWATLGPDAGLLGDARRLVVAGALAGAAQLEVHGIDEQEHGKDQRDSRGVQCDVQERGQSSSCRSS